MEKILSFASFTERDTVVEETETVDVAVDEAVDIQALGRSSSSKADLKNKLVAKLKKTAPTLADDDDFVEKLVNSFDTEEEKESK
jgi:hypothetical protein